MPILLLAGLLASGVMFIRTVFFCYRGEFPRARLAIFQLVAGAAVYAVVLGISARLAPHERTLKTGRLYCDDDVCMSVERYSITPEPKGRVYRFEIRLSSLANRGVRSAKGFSPYLTDEQNRRFPAIRNESSRPFDVDLQPGSALNTSITFHAPSDARNLALAVVADRIQYASFVIGNGDLLHNPRLKLRLE